MHFRRCKKKDVDETKRRLKDRFNEQRRPVDGPTPSSTPTAIAEHFNADDHSQTYCKLPLLSPGLVQFRMGFYVGL